MMSADFNIIHLTDFVTDVSQYSRFAFSHCCLPRPVVLLLMAAGLGLVLEFMYTAKLSLSLQNVEDVLAVANFLEMQEIINACSAYQSMANTAPSLITLDFPGGESSIHVVFSAFSMSACRK